MMLTEYPWLLYSYYTSIPFLCRFEYVMTRLRRQGEILESELTFSLSSILALRFHFETDVYLTIIVFIFFWFSEFYIVTSRPWRSVIILFISHNIIILWFIIVSSYLHIFSIYVIFYQINLLLISLNYGLNYLLVG